MEKYKCVGIQRLQGHSKKYDNDYDISNYHCVSCDEIKDNGTGSLTEILKVNNILVKDLTHYPAIGDIITPIYNRNGFIVDIISG